MKKKKLILVVMMIIVMVVFGLVACGASVTGIELKSGTLDSTVTQGETFDTSTAVVYAYYSNNSQEEVGASDLTFSDVDTSATGTVQLTISYEGFSIVHNITVEEKAAELGETVTSLAVQAGTIPNKVAVGGTLDLSGAIVIATMDDGLTQTITSSDLTFTTISTDVAGTQTLRISYGGKTVAYSVEVVEDSTGLDDIATLAIEVGSIANIVQYDGELDLSELVLIATYGNGIITNITEGYTVSGLDTSVLGDQTITFTYDDATVTHEVTVSATAEEQAMIVVSIAITEGTVASSVVVDGTLSTSSMTIIVTYYSGKTATISTGFVVGDIDTDTVGSKTFDVSYTDTFGNVVTTKVNYEVVTAASLITVMNLESDLLKDFEANSGLSSDNNAGFLSDATTVLYAGDYNDFHFRAVAYATDSNDNLLAYTMSQVETSVSIKIDGVELTATQLATYFDDIDYTNVTFDFSEQAVGKTFTITVTATKFGGSSGNDTFTANVTIMSGYNLYEEYELSLYDNRNSFYGGTDTWTAFKTYYGINDIDVDAIDNFILQADLVLTMDDIAKSLLWSDGTLVDELGNTLAKTANYDTAVTLTDSTLLGTLRDVNGNGIYNRDIVSDQETIIEGNYFTIDASNILTMVVEEGVTNGVTGAGTADTSDDNAMTSHTSLFYHSYETPESGNMYEVDADGNSVTDGAQITWTNLGMTGNAANDGSVANSGGLIAVKSNTVSFSAINNVTNYFYIAYFFNRHSGDYLEYRDESETYILDNCKMLNTYQNTLYVQMVKELLIVDSIIDGCGGPAIISDSKFWDADTTTDDYTGTEDLLFGNTINVVNSTITTTLSGNEPWFTTYGATPLVTKLTAANVFFNGDAGLPDTGYSLTQEIEGTDYLNVICVFKRFGEMSVGSGDSAPVGGTYTEYASWEEYLSGTTRYYSTDSTSTAATTDPDSEIMFESTATGGYISAGFGTSNSLCSLFSAGIPYYGDGNINIYIPDYGFMVVVELFKA